jgi:hypothetical protein
LKSVGKVENWEVKTLSEIGHVGTEIKGNDE